MFYETLAHYFSKYNKHFIKSFLSFCEAMFLSCSSNSWEVARKMSAVNNANFKATEMRRYRLLSNSNFVVDDSLFRCNLNILMDSLEQNKKIIEGDKILIAIDFTTMEDKYLIITASLIIDENSYPIYFSLRNYPKTKARFDQKKMEKSFLKSLKHLLSKRFQYIIVADRGFGNKRLIDICQETGFEYVIRIEPNMNGKYNNEITIIRNLFKEDGSKNIHVKKWQQDIDFHKISANDSEWFLISNNKDYNHIDCGKIYEKRFKIEKVFQNLKSSGFDIENSKINQYSKFKRLLFCCFLCYNILILLGDHINSKMHNLKKNLSICESLILAYLASQERQLPIFTQGLEVH